MRAILGVCLTLGIALALSAASIFGLHDRTVLVAPPEAVVEDFVRGVIHHRYGPALRHFSHALRTEGVDGLRRLGTDIESRRITILNVQGHRLWMNENRAGAHAYIKGDGTSETLHFLLSLERGMWRIEGIHF